MPSYNHCIASLSLNGKIPARELKDTAAAYQAQGLSSPDAMIRAVEDKLELARMDERRIVKVVREAYEAQGGKKRKPRSTPAVAEKVKPKTTEKVPEVAPNEAEPRFSVAGKTDTAAFKKWFGDSKVVDETGEPLVVYHGTNVEFSEFQPGDTEWTSGIFLTSSADVAANVYAGGQAEFNAEGLRTKLASMTGDEIETVLERARKANRGFEYYEDFNDPSSDARKDFVGYLENEFDPSEGVSQKVDRIVSAFGVPPRVPTAGANVIPAYASLQNPLKIDAKGDAFDHEQQSEWFRKARAGGHDGLIIKNYEDGGFGAADTYTSAGRHTVYVAFKPAQVKSAIGNNGEFSAGSGDIRYSAVQGQEEAALGKAGLRHVIGKGLLGPVIHSMVDAGVVVLHASPATLPRNIGHNVKGVQAVTTPDGKIHLVAGNLTAATARGVLLHEMFHNGAEPLLGAEQWRALMRSMGALYRQSEQSSGKARTVFDRARKRVATAKARGAVAVGMEAEEFAAYAIEEYERAPGELPAALRKWVEDLIGAVKAFVAKRFGKQLGQITPAQLSALAKWAVLDHAAQQRGKIFGDHGEWFSVDGDQKLVPFIDGLREKYPSLRFDLMEKRNGDLHLSRIVAPIDRREQGNGTAFMRDLAAFADQSGQRVTLTPSSDFGGSKPRLLAFYKRFGFVENKGRNKDFSTMEGMYRDPQEGSAKYSVASDDETGGLAPPDQGTLRRLQGNLQDNMNRVRQVQDRIEQVLGRPLAERSDYYAAETNRPGRIAARLEDAERGRWAPLMARLAKSGHTQEQLSALLHAQHAEERNAAVARINPDMPDGGSGMTNDEAQATIALHAGDTELHAIAKQARDIARATLDLKLTYGLITPETHETLATMYKNYVPLKGDGEFGPKVKRAMGHEERDEHILENISRDYDQAVVVGEKNLARQSLLRMVLQNLDPELWTVGIPPKGRYVAGKVYAVMKGDDKLAAFTSQSQVAAFLEAKGAEAAGLRVVDSAGEQVIEFAKPLQDNEVMVYVKGEPVRIQIVGDEALARQLRPLKQDQMGPMLERMRGLNRWLSKVYTGYNPAFILRNAARDAMTGTVNMLGNQGVVTAAKAWAKYPAALAVLTRWAATGKAPAGDMGKALVEYRQHGGKTGASYMSDLEQQGKTLERLFDDAYGAAAYARDGRPGKAAAIAGRKAIGALAHVIEIANQATENGLRLALYATLREQGTTPGAAARAAKTVTVDFDRKGTQTGAMGALYLFFNPAVQGAANAVKTLAKGRHKGQAWTALGGLALLGMYAAMTGMDEDKDRWLGEGWEARGKNFILNVGGRQFRLPLSQEFAPAYAMGVALGEASRGESKAKAAMRVLSSFIDAYFPLKVVKEDSDNRLADAALGVTPTVGLPLAQMAFNRNTFGSDIVPETDLTKDRSDNLKMFRGTKNTVYDKSAQGIAALGEMLGAGKYENDITKVSPETLKMLWRTYTGGLGTFVTDTAGLASMLADDAGQVESGDVPIWKDFVKPHDIKPIRGRYHDLARDAKAAITEFEQAKKASDGAAMQEIAADPAKARVLRVGGMVRKVSQATASLRDQAVDVNADTKLTTAEKRAELKRLEEQEAALYRSAIAVFR